MLLFLKRDSRQTQKATQKRQPEFAGFFYYSACFTKTAGVKGQANHWEKRTGNQTKRRRMKAARCSALRKAIFVDVLQIFCYNIKNLVKSIDNFRRKVYTCVYEKCIVVLTLEKDITLSGELIYLKNTLFKSAGRC